MQPRDVAARLLGGALALAGATTMVGCAVVTASPARAAARARPCWSCCRCAAPPTGSRSSCRTATPSTTQARPRIAVPPDRLLVKDGFFGLHPALRAAGAALDRRQARGGARHRAAGAQPLALRGHGGDGGRRPGLGDAGRLAEPADGGTPDGDLAAAGVQRRRQHHPDLAGRTRRRRCRPGGSTTSSCRATTENGGAGASLQIMWNQQKSAAGPQHARRPSRPSTRSGRPRRAAGQPRQLPGHRPGPGAGHRRADHPRRRRASR